MFLLITTYYQSTEPEREAENLECLKQNINNPLIERIYLFLQGNDFPEIVDIDSKIKYLNFGKRPFFSDLFAFANTIENNKIKIVSNSDIYFDGSLIYSNDILDKFDVITLTRWDSLGNGELDFYNNFKSQDVWIFSKRIKDTIGKFHIGRHGCDNRLIFELNENKYKVANPSFSIRAIHLHRSDLRSYFNDPDYEYVKAPYGYVLPTYLNKGDLNSKVLKKQFYFTRYSYYRALRGNKLPGLHLGLISRLMGLVAEKFYAIKVKKFG
jgi:hypothetical protein